MLFNKKKYWNVNFDRTGRGLVICDIAGGNLCRPVFFEASGRFQRFPATCLNGILSFINYKGDQKTRLNLVCLQLVAGHGWRQVTHATSSHHDLIMGLLLGQKRTRIPKLSHLIVSSFKNVTGTARNCFIFQN